MVLAVVKKWWHGERLDIYFGWTSISWWAWTKHMCCFPVVENWICKDSVDLKGFECAVILGVNFFSIKQFLKELSFFWVSSFFTVGQLDHKILGVLVSCLGLCWNWTSNDLDYLEQTNRCIRGTWNDNCWKPSYTA